MNWKTILQGPFAALIASASLLGSCGDPAPSAEGASAGQGAVVTEPPAERDEARLLARVSDRWDQITHGDWIQAYDFLRPERKRVETLSRFISGKENHEYKNPSKPSLLAINGDQAFVQMEVLWTPHHPEIAGAHNMPPEGLTQLLPMIETWTWVDSEWYWVDTTRRNDFFRDHPEYAPRRKGARDDGEPTLDEQQGG